MTGPRPAVLPIPLVLLACAALFAAGLGLYTRHNAIPYYYHSDEPSKVNQVVGERRLNFKHPLLLMNGTRALAAVTGVGADKQRAALAGRTVSAAFAALSVALLVALAWLQRGGLAALCVAPVVLLSHGLFTFAHFMKEDTALLLGVVATLLAAAIQLRHPSRVGAAVLGAAAALALSGKYIGVVMLAVALPVAALARRGEGGGPRAGVALALFAAGFATTLLVVNVTVLFEWKRFRAGLAYETDHASTGGGKPFSTLLSPAYVFGLLSQSTWPVRILAPAWVVYVVATWRRRRADERLVALFPVAYLAILQASPIKAIRYLLPVVVMAHFLAGLAVAALLARVPGGARARALAGVLAAGVVLTPQVARLRVHLESFASDGRLLLYDHVRTRVPSGSPILQDRYAGLPDPAWGYWTGSNAPLPHPITTRHFAPEFGDLAAMRAAGIEYVAVCSRAYDRFFGEEKAFGSAEARARFESLRAGYEELFREADLVFEAGRARIAGAPVDPTVRLYHLTPGTDLRVKEKAQ